jgi:hypothetical protein
MFAEGRDTHDFGSQNVHVRHCPALRRKSIPCPIEAAPQIRHVFRFEHSGVYSRIIAGHL